MTRDAPASPQTMVDVLTSAGVLHDPAWRKAFLAVPRHLFVPGYDPDLAYSDDALVTQTRTAQVAGGGSAELPTSSASAPSVVAAMLDRLAVRDGMRVLEIGTGTGYNAALLAHRLGGDQVYSVDLDPELAAAAGTVLGMLGYRVYTAAADGYEGLPGAAPFDRIIATCAITHVPPPWIHQLASGGRIVAPLFAEGAPLAVFDKTADDEVTGRIDTCHAAFMPLRPEIDNPLPAGRQLGFPTMASIGHYGTTTLDPSTLTEMDPDRRLFLALYLPALSVGTIEMIEGGHGEAVLIGTPEGSAQVAVNPDSDGRWTVVQHGRRLWDTVEHAMRDWADLGTPARTRYGISAADDPARQYVWLDDPDGRFAWPFLL